MHQRRKSGKGRATITARNGSDPDLPLAFLCPPRVITEENKTIVKGKERRDIWCARIRRLTRLALPPYANDCLWAKDDVVDIYHWMKQLIAIGLGIAFGCAGLTGWIGYASLLGILSVLSEGYLRCAQIPDDILTGSEAFKEGLMPAIMTFTLFWTASYTICR